jgi:hypothetical protein
MVVKPCERCGLLYIEKWEEGKHSDYKNFTQQLTGKIKKYEEKAEVHKRGGFEAKEVSNPSHTIHLPRKAQIHEGSGRSNNNLRSLSRVWNEIPPSPSSICNTKSE